MAEDNLDSAFRRAAELHRAGRVSEAEPMLRAIAAVNPDHPGALYRLGMISHRRGELTEARGLLWRACRVDRREPAFPYTLGMVLHDLGDLDGAAKSYREAIARRSDFAEAWNNLALVLQDAKHLDDARQALEQALKIRPGYVAALGNLASVITAQGNALVEQQREREAKACYGEAWALRPQNLATALKAMLTLPAVPASTSELDAARGDYAQGLEALHAALPAFAELDRGAILDQLGHTNFLLAYQGRDDRALQARYGDFVHALLTCAAPEWMQPPSRRSAAGGKRRVAFVSRFFRRCTAGLYFKSWVSGLDRRRCDVTVVSLSPQEDEITAQIRAASDRFIASPGKVAAVAEAIRDAAPDILVYPELGMDARTFVLAALRLAPLQCAGWGHPVTTGLPNVDVFLSAEAIEPNDASAHYRERLVLLPGLGTGYPRPQVPQFRSRAALGLPEDRTLYLFPHSAFKVHPDTDALLARVVEGDPNAMLVLFEGETEATTRALASRLQTTGIGTAKMIVLPAMPHEDYLGVNLACDAMLDTMHWSGGNTSLDALACGLPVVTLPGAFMRGRQTAAMLTMAGVPELIARDGDDYVQIALRLGREPAWRAALAARLRDGAGAVFDRREPIAALQRFIESAATAAT